MPIYSANKIEINTTPQNKAADVFEMLDTVQSILQPLKSEGSINDPATLKNYTSQAGSVDFSENPSLYWQNVASLLDFFIWELPEVLLKGINDLSFKEKYLRLRWISNAIDTTQYFVSLDKTSKTIQKLDIQAYTKIKEVSNFLPQAIVIVQQDMANWPWVLKKYSTKYIAQLKDFINKLKTYQHTFKKLALSSQEEKNYLNGFETENSLMKPHGNEGNAEHYCTTSANSNSCSSRRPSLLDPISQISYLSLSRQFSGDSEQEAEYLPQPAEEAESEASGQQEDSTASSEIMSEGPVMTLEDKKIDVLSHEQKFKEIEELARWRKEYEQHKAHTRGLAKSTHKQMKQSMLQNVYEKENKQLYMLGLKVILSILFPVALIWTVPAFLRALQARSDVVCVEATACQRMQIKQYSRAFKMAATNICPEQFNYRKDFPPIVLTGFDNDKNEKYYLHRAKAERWRFFARYKGGNIDQNTVNYIKNLQSKTQQFEQDMDFAKLSLTKGL